MVFEFEELFYYEGFVWWAKLPACEGFGKFADVLGDVREVFSEV